LVGKFEGTITFEDLGTDGMIILRWILKKVPGRVGLHSFGSGQGITWRSYCEHGNNLKVP
jgi:hypothetical protein